jgi:hypothetical protein
VFAVERYNTIGRVKFSAPTRDIVDTTVCDASVVTRDDGTRVVSTSLRGCNTQ